MKNLAKTYSGLAGELGESIPALRNLTAEEMKANHSGLPHGGSVIRSGKTGWNEEHNNLIEYSLKLDSNPEFTASVLVAYARAAYRMSLEGQCGCKTVLDIPPAYLSACDADELRRRLLCRVRHRQRSRCIR